MGLELGSLLIIYWNPVEFCGHCSSVAINMSYEAAFVVETDVDTDTGPAAVSPDVVDINAVMIVEWKGVDTAVTLIEVEIGHELLLVRFEGAVG